MARIVKEGAWQCRIEDICFTTAGLTLAFQDSKDMILKVDGYFCNRLSNEREYHMEFCPVIHVMANSFEATIWSVSNNLII